MIERIAAARQESAEQDDDRMGRYQARVAQLEGEQRISGGYAGSANNPPNAARQAGGRMNTPSGAASYGNFGKQPGVDRWELSERMQAPRTSFEFRAGGVIPGTLISGINSDLPGQIMGQVSQNVYDTATGRHVLIPQGTRLVGSYSSEIAYGQARVLVAWQRLVFPDGKALDIGAMPGADSAGYAGAGDQVNNHYARLFGSALLMSGITAGVALSQRNTQGYAYGPPNANTVLSESMGQQLGRVATQLISRNMSISPTLEIRPGYRFNVVATKDLTFTKPYKPFDY